MNKVTKELLKKNRIREKSILEDNQEIYTNMVVYLRGSDLSEYSQELVREDIIELIVEGQHRGDNIQTVMGGRYKEICDEIVEAMPKKTRKDKILGYIGTSFNALWILGGIVFLRNLAIGLSSSSQRFEFDLRYGDLISIVVITVVSNVVIDRITKNAFEENQGKSVSSFLKTWSIATLIFAVILLSNIYLSSSFVKIPLWLGAVIIIFFYIAGKRINAESF